MSDLLVHALSIHDCREELEGGPSILRLLARTASDDSKLYGSDALAAVQASIMAVVFINAYQA